MIKENTIEPSTKIIGRNIRRWRELREISGENLAHMVGLKKGQISNIENGNSPEISWRKLEEIAKALDLTMQQLLFSDPQSMITFIDSPNTNGMSGVNNYGSLHHSIDMGLIEELRQQLKVKDDQIQFLQTQFKTK